MAKTKTVPPIEADLPRRRNWQSPESGGRNVGWSEIQPIAERAQVVAVAWNDAHINTAHATARDIEHRPVVCITVGVLVYADDDGVSLAMSLNDVGDVRGHSFIPKGMVIEQWEIGPLRKAKKS
jgi:hypothetical protein